MTIRELQPSSGRGFRIFFRKEKLRRFVKVPRRARRFPMTQFVPLQQSAKCDNTVKLLRVNKDQYTKQRGHRKIFTGRKGVPLLFFFMNSPLARETSRRSNIPRNQTRNRASLRSFLLSRLFRTINSFTARTLLDLINEL